MTGCFHTTGVDPKVLDLNQHCLWPDTSSLHVPIAQVYVIISQSFNFHFSFQKNSEICTYSYPDTVLSVCLNRQVNDISHDIT